MEIITLKAFGGCFRLRIYFYPSRSRILLKTLWVMGLWSSDVILDSQRCFSNPVAVGGRFRLENRAGPFLRMETVGRHSDAHKTPDV